MLSEPTRRLASGMNFAVLTTLMPGGSPQAHVMWIDEDGEHLLINTEEGRQKLDNIDRDPRVAIVIWNRSSPYEYVEVRGQVVERVTGAPARDNIEELTQKYQGLPADPSLIGERVLLKVRAEREYYHRAPRPVDRV